MSKFVPDLAEEAIERDAVAMLSEFAQARDRAVIAFILLTGARDGAIASMKL